MTATYAAIVAFFLSAGSDDVAKQLYVKFEATGRRVPTHDPRLDRAAMYLAERLLLHGEREVQSPETQRQALKAAGLSDPSPRILITKSNSRQTSVDAFLKRTDLHNEASSHWGLALLDKGSFAAIVAIFSERAAIFENLPDFHPRVSEPKEICFRILRRVRHEELFVSTPGGRIHQLPLATKEDEMLTCATLSLSQEGAYVLELVGRTESGPSVLARVDFNVGAAMKPLHTTASTKEIQDDVLPRAILERINRIRRSAGVGTLAPHFELDRVASAYAKRMAEENFFSHTAPDGSTLALRLGQTRFNVGKRCENLGWAPAPIEAHLEIERSPAHAKNLTDFNYTHIGIGVSPKTTELGTSYIVVEILAEARDASNSKK